VRFYAVCTTATADAHVQSSKERIWKTCVIRTVMLLGLTVHSSVGGVYTPTSAFNNSAFRQRVYLWASYVSHSKHLLFS
jgi:hypothetical protein